MSVTATYGYGYRRRRVRAGSAVVWYCYSVPYSATYDECEVEVVPVSWWSQ